jgi:hypothetical protein
MQGAPRRAYRSMFHCVAAVGRSWKVLYMLLAGTYLGASKI